MNKKRECGERYKNVCRSISIGGWDKIESFITSAMILDKAVPLDAALLPIELAGAVHSDRMGGWAQILQSVTTTCMEKNFRSRFFSSLYRIGNWTEKIINARRLDWFFFLQFIAFLKKQRVPEFRRRSKNSERLRDRQFMTFVARGTKVRPLSQNVLYRYILARTIIDIYKTVNGQVRNTKREACI